MTTISETYWLTVPCGVCSGIRHEMSGEYESLRRVVYGEGATFVPVCPLCGRFVKRDRCVTFTGEGQPRGPNGTCKKDGRVQMLFEGYIE